MEKMGVSPVVGTIITDSDNGSPSGGRGGVGGRVGDEGEPCCDKICG